MLPGACTSSTENHSLHMLPAISLLLLNVYSCNQLVTW